MIKLSQSLSIHLSGLDGRNMVMRCLERRYGSVGITFMHSMRTKKSSEYMILPYNNDQKFLSSLARYRKKGACTFLVLDDSDEVHVGTSAGKQAIDLTGLKNMAHIVTDALISVKDAVL